MKKSNKSSGFKLAKGLVPVGLVFTIQ